MSETVTEIKIVDRAQFEAVAKTYGVEIGKRGALPKRALLVKVREAVAAGKVKLIETEFFGVDAVLNGVSVVKRGALVWTITYRVKDAETGKLSDVSTLTITAEQIKRVLPDAALQGAKLNGVVATVMVGFTDGATLAELSNYVVTSVVRAETNAEATTDAPNGEDTGGENGDQQKTPETLAVTDTDKVEEKTPELVPAETPKPAAKPRSARKTPAKK